MGHVSPPLSEKGEGGEGGGRWGEGGAKVGSGTGRVRRACAVDAPRTDVLVRYDVDRPQLPVVRRHP
jgi:hypothetical protein